MADNSETPPKKRKYKFILQYPAEKLTGWQEVVMDIGKIGDSLSNTQRPNLSGRKE